DDGVKPEGHLDKILDELIGDGPAEAIAAAVRVEPKQMVAIFGGFADPELADRAAVDKNIMHHGSPDVWDAPRPTKVASSGTGRVTPCESLAILRCTIRLTTRRLAFQGRIE